MDRRLIVHTAAFVGAALFLIWALITWTSSWNGQRYAGTVLALIGIGGVALARYQLGKSFAVRPEARELVTSGLYSRIRNPIYVFGLVMLVGLALVLQIGAAWIVVAALAVVQMIRAHREAGVLEAAFGDSYREYRCKTWF
jgi:protein-S-isoprenylcysteine O-methyltransferase Ste14